MDLRGPQTDISTLNSLPALIGQSIDGRETPGTVREIYLCYDRADRLNALRSMLPQTAIKKTVFSARYLLPRASVSLRPLNLKTTQKTGGLDLRIHVLATPQVTLLQVTCGERRCEWNQLAREGWRSSLEPMKWRRCDPVCSKGHVGLVRPHLHFSYKHFT